MTTSRQSDPGRVTTFYSYKGGTGRTMLLANVAWILATAGRRVLAIDWDLEAPGLHHYFAPFLIDPALIDTEGLIDMVIDYASDAVSLSEDVVLDDLLNERTETADYKVSIAWDFPRGGLLDLIPAGRQNASYSTRFNAFDWHHFYTQLGGGVFFDRLRERMVADYDFVLIDSRTGVSDTSGICTVQFPDSVVACFTASEQSMAGVAGIAESIKSQWRSLGFAEDRRVFPVMCRVEQAEKEKLEIARGRARELFAKTLRPLNETEQDFYWSNKQVLYWPWYAYEEVLAVFGDRDSYAGSVLSACEAVADLVTGSAVRKLEIAPSPPDRDRVLARYARKGGKSVFNAIAVLVGESWSEAEFVLESLRAEVGRRITTIAWPDLREAADRSPDAPLLVFFDRRPFVDMMPDTIATLRTETARARKMIVVLLPNCPKDVSIPAELSGCPRIAFDDLARRDDSILSLRHLVASGEIVALDDARFADLRRKHRLAAAAADWIKSDRDRDFLLRGTALSEVESWRERSSDPLTVAERDFMEASRFAHNELDLAQRLENAHRAEAKALARLEVAEEQKRYAEEQRTLADQASSLTKEAMIEVKARSEAASGSLREAEQRSQRAAEREQRAEERERRNDKRAKGTLRYAIAATALVTVLSATIVGRFVVSGRGQDATNQNLQITVARLKTDADQRQKTANEVPLLIARARQAEASDPTFGILLLSEAIERSRDVLLSPSAEAARMLQRLLDTIQSRPLFGHTGPINAVDVSADGTTATASQDGTIRLWTADGNAPWWVSNQYANPLVAVAFNATSSLIAAGSDDGTVLLYDRNSPRPRRLSQGRYPVRSVGFYGNNILFATYVGGPATLFDIGTDKPVAFSPVKPLGEPIFVAAAGPRLVGLRQGGLVIADGNGNVFTAAIDQDVLRPHLDAAGKALVSGPPNITALSVSRDGRLIAVGASDGKVSLSLNDGSPDGARRLPFGDAVDDGLRNVNVSSGFANPAGGIGRLVVGLQTIAGRVLVKDVLDETPSTIVDRSQSATLEVVSPYGESVLTATQSSAKLTCLVDKATEKEMPLEGITGVMSSAAFDPQSRFLVTASDDGTARIWLLASGKGCLTILKPSPRLASQEAGKAGWIDGLLINAGILAGRNFTGDEWCQTFGQDPWHATFQALMRGRPAHAESDLTGGPSAGASCARRD